MMNRRICLYNGADLDGIASAAIVKLRYPEVLLYSLTYDDPFDCEDIIHPEDEVLILNFTLQPFERMIQCWETCDLSWITHSDTSIDEYNQAVEDGIVGEIKGTRNRRRSSCEMTWEYLYPEEKPTPYTIWLLGKYGIWDYDPSPSIIPFQFGMKLNYQPPEDTEFWFNVFNAERDGEFVHGIMNDGHTIIKYRNKLNKKICEVQAFESTLMGYKALCVNRALCGSTVFNSIWDHENHDLMAVFFICNEGAWNVSLYSDKPEVDVGSIAKTYGGGGSENASGFRCSVLPLSVNS